SNSTEVLAHDRLRSVHRPNLLEPSRNGRPVARVRVEEREIAERVSRARLVPVAPREPDSRLERLPRLRTLAQPVRGHPRHAARDGSPEERPVVRALERLENVRASALEIAALEAVERAQQPLPAEDRLRRALGAVDERIGIVEPATIERHPR